MVGPQESAGGSLVKKEEIREGEKRKVFRLELSSSGSDSSEDEGGKKRKKGSKKSRNKHKKVKFHP